MKVVQITDEDAKALLDKLALAKYQEPPFSHTMRELPEATREAVMAECHRHFHYEVVKWLQTHGATVT